MTNHKKYYKPNGFAAKAKADRTRSRVKMRIHRINKSPEPGFRLGALASPGRFFVVGAGHRIGIKHFSV
jgi:hypothetical protein